MDRLVQSVRQHVQFRRHFRHAPRPIEQLLRLFQHWSFQHRRRTVARLGRVEPLGAVVPIHLHIPLHRDHRHAKRLDDLFGFHRPAGNHLAGEHAETPYVLLLVLEHRQVAVEIKHPARLSLYGDLAVDLRHPGRKNRQLKLRHTSLLPQLPPAPQVRLGIIPFSLPGKKHGARSGDLTYGYTDERGELLYQIVRFEPKGFSQRYPDGNGGWAWKKHPRQVLYHLPEVLESPIIFLPEGEKDCETLREGGFVATTNAGGAQAPW